MKTYLTGSKYEHGPCELEKAVRAQKTLKSQISNHLIEITIGENAIFFYMQEYGIDGFSLSRKDLGILLAELKTREGKEIQ